MREIKFRAWDEDAKEFVYSDIPGDDYFFEFLEGTLKAKRIVERSYGLPEERAYTIGLKEPQQYTGLKDKNGKEIYEGDIIGVDGLKKGDIYENPNLLKETTNLIIQDFGGKAWCATHKKALERGCRYSK